MSGKSWEKIRNSWRESFSEISIVTIAESASDTRAFSADTGMAECLVIAKKGGAENRRANFIVLNRQPEDTLMGALLAQEISKVTLSGHICRLEDGPFGGTVFRLGNDAAGEILNCPLPVEGAWQIVGIDDLSLAQTACQLQSGTLWIEGMPPEAAVTIPVSQLRSVIERVGPHDLDLTGAQIKPDGMPQGPFEKIIGNSDSSPYPTLWNHSTHDERRLVVQPDSHCRIRQVDGQVPAELQSRAASRWVTASRAHYNRDLQFNSQSICLALTESPSLGGRAWPTIVLSNPDHEFALSLWSNSTLGLLSHWWMANKSQSGRGTYTITSIPTIPTLNLDALNENQHDAARLAFNRIKENRLLPFDQIDEDASRHEIDRSLLIEVLGLPDALCAASGPIDLLRRKLAREPQIHGGKATRVIFTDEGEITERRSDR